MILLNWI